MNKIGVEAVICAGGFGTRLTPITGDKVPKPMADIHNTQHKNLGTAVNTILLHQIRQLSEYGITDFNLLVGYKKELIEKAFTNEIVNKLIPNRNINIKFYEETSPLGTGGALCDKNFQDMIKTDNFLYTYADYLYDINLVDLYVAHLNQRAHVTTLVNPSRTPDAKHLCEFVKGTNIIERFIKRPEDAQMREENFSNMCHHGIMMFNKEVFNHLPKGPIKFDMEDGVLATLINDPNIKVCGFESPCHVEDIGTVERFHKQVMALGNNLPAIKNPEKTPQSCVIFNENNLVYQDAESGQMELNQHTAKAISVLNESGIIVGLYKGDSKLERSDETDKEIDTLLVRESDGAYVNFKFQNDEQLVNYVDKWNIQDTKVIEQVTENEVLLTNIENSKMEVHSSILGATYRILQERNETYQIDIPDIDANVVLE